MSDGPMFALTLDLENDWHFDDPALDHLVLAYLEDFLGLISEFALPLSVFVVGQTLEQYPEKVDLMRDRLDCEFHLHSYQHDTSKSYDFETEVRRGMEAFRTHFGRDPVGYRAPQGNIEPHEFLVLQRLGFSFDSSIIPSYRPGKYSNLGAPLEPYTPDITDALLEIPMSTFRGLRIPVSHSYFKLFGQPLCRYLSVAPLPKVLVYNIHLHDLYRTASHDALDVPKRWIMKRNLDNAISMFRSNMRRIVSRGYQPVTLTSVYDAVKSVEGSGELGQEHRIARTHGVGRY